MKNQTIYPATLLCDFYKISHREQYPQGTEKVYSTWTPRTSRKEGINRVVCFGVQAFIKQYLIDYFNDNFFNRDEKEIVEEYTRVIKYTLNKTEIDVTHILALHRLGYLPIKIKAIMEGTPVPIRVPMLTIENTKPEFFWLTNYLETLMSCQLWQPMTSATIASEYKKIVDKYAYKTVGNTDCVPFQCHDFSLRGMGSFESSLSSGAGHLLSFAGTDSIPSILYMEKYYNADISKELVGTSIPATEHSVMCAYGDADEMDTFKHLINDVYPSGLLSIVSDTWDLWKVLTSYLPELKDDVLKRDGKLVIRPDSGDPVKIICGDDSYFIGSPEYKGVIELLWETFGGTVNKLGYKELDSHIGAIYGDSITPQRADEICRLLQEKGFASSNIVFGVGSFTYQYNTRDTFGFALKATYAVVDGKERFLFKNPITDNGTKKSQRGMVVVVPTDNGSMKYIDGLGMADMEEYKDKDILKTVFEDGKLVRDLSLKDIRAMLDLSKIIK